jgi:uncharacterized OB-fold protein
MRSSHLPADLVDLHPDAWTRPFWEAAREHRLVAPRCLSCGSFRMPPGPYCHVCRTQSVEWIELSGDGTVFTFTVVRHALIPALVGAVPYVVSVVDLTDAPPARLVAALVDVDPESVCIGMPVTLVWDDIDDDQTVPRFTPTSK